MYQKPYMLHHPNGGVVVVRDSKTQIYVADKWTAELIMNWLYVHLEWLNNNYGFHGTT